MIWHKQTNSSRHLEDIQSVLAITKVDKNYLKRWANKLDLSKEMEKVINNI
jgi:hypothetical protein